jgi:FAD dependent oxidoreductase TIGR03364
MSPREHFDDAVVGAGILGLAHAYHLARRGRRVVVFERGRRAAGASVRNFGMIWPIGQPAGPLRRLAMRSREVWLDVLGVSGLWHDRAGSLHLAYRDDEARVLAEFAGRARGDGSGYELLTPGEVRRRSPLVRAEGLLAGLFSPWETCVDPREVVAGLPGWLARARGVRFEFGRTVVGFDRPRVVTSDPERVPAADRLWVCAGDDFETLYPEAFQALGLARCKLQMMRAEPPGDGLRIGPMLAAGLTLRHYKSFEGCPSLPALRERVARESPEFDRYGIHVMASQNGRGEVVIGDSHEYDDAAGPFDKPAIDALILDYLATLLDAQLVISARWHGTYAKHPTEPYTVVAPAPGVTAVTATGGAGMTLSFGLAEQVVNRVLGGD